MLHTVYEVQWTAGKRTTSHAPTVTVALTAMAYCGSNQLNMALCADRYSPPLPHARSPRHTDTALSSPAAPDSLTRRPALPQSGLLDISPSRHLTRQQSPHRSSHLPLHFRS